jgi:hypothetical protein
MTSKKINIIEEIHYVFLNTDYSELLYDLSDDPLNFLNKKIDKEYGKDMFYAKLIKTDEEIIKSENTTKKELKIIKEITEIDENVNGILFKMNESESPTISFIPDMFESLVRLKYFDPWGSLFPRKIISFDDVVICYFYID